MSMILLLIPLCVVFPARGETNKRSRESNTLHLIPRKSSKLGQSIFNKIIESADDPALRFQQPMTSFTIYLLVSRTAASDLLEAPFQIEKIIEISRADSQYVAKCHPKAVAMSQTTKELSGRNKNLIIHVRIKVGSMSPVEILFDCAPDTPDTKEGGHHAQESLNYSSAARDDVLDSCLSAEASWSPPVPYRTCATGLLIGTRQ